VRKLRQLWSLEPAEGKAGGGCEEFSGAWYLQRGDIAYWEGDFVQALREYSRAVDEERTLEAAWVGQAIALLRLGNPGQVETLCVQGRRLFPKSSALLSLQASAKARQGDLQGALALSDTALSLQSKGWLDWLQRGDVLLAFPDELTTARRSFQQALDEAPDVDFTRREIAFNCLEHGYFEDAARFFADVVKAVPTVAENWYRYALSLHGAQQRQAALEALQHALELAPANTNYLALYEILRAKGPLTWLKRLLNK